MRFISCYINNFGKLSNVSFDFESGVNMIQQDNGWGKTTFSVFLKAMLFGMECKLRKSKKNSERERYFPWNGGAYGGELVFEVEGKQYKIERYFRKKDRNDTCVLYDLTNNTQIEDYSEVLGESIWGIDRDSYEKTAFLSLQQTSLLNEFISDKMGDIKEQERTLDDSEKAILELERKMHELGNSNGGVLHELGIARANSETQLEAARNSRVVVQEIEQLKNEKYQELEDAKQERLEVEAQVKELRLYGRKRMYENLKTEFATSKDAVNHAMEFFKGNIIEAWELTQLERNIKLANQKSDKLNESFLQPNEELEYVALQKAFIRGVPSSEEINANYNLLLTNHELEGQIKPPENYDLWNIERKELEEQYKTVIGTENAVDVDEHIQHYNQTMKCQIQETVLREQKEVLERKDQENKKKQSKRKTNSIYMGMLFIILGVVLGVTMFGFGNVFWDVSPAVLFGVAAAMGGMFIIVGLIVIMMAVNRHNKNELVNDELAHDMKVVQEQLDMCVAEKESSAKVYMTFLGTLGKEDEENVLAALLTVKSHIQDYRNLVANIDGHIKTVGEVSEIIRKNKEVCSVFVEKYLGQNQDQNQELDLKYGLDQIVGMIQRFAELNVQVEKYDDIAAELEVLKGAIEACLREYMDEIPENYGEGADIIKRQLTILEERLSHTSKIEIRLETFVQLNPVPELDAIVLSDEADDVRFARLMSEKEEIENRIEQILHIITTLDNDKERELAVVRTIPEVEYQLDDLEAKTIEATVEYSRYELAKRCMEEAKEAMIQRYIGDMAEAFRYYLERLGIENVSNYILDMYLQVQVKVDGEYKESLVLSRGEKDIVEICLRMALIEAVYKDTERPPLILDDPFTNLDNEGVDLAIELVHTIAERYQVIYFICHDSRGRK